MLVPLKLCIALTRFGVVPPELVPTISAMAGLPVVVIDVVGQTRRICCSLAQLWVILLLTLLFTVDGVVIVVAVKIDDEGTAAVVVAVVEGAAVDIIMGIPLRVELMRLLAVTKLTGELDELNPRMVAEPDDDEEQDELDWNRGS